MPEGDTIWRAARTLDQVLAGKTIEHAESNLIGPDAARLRGRRIERVTAHGKYLIIELDDGRALNTHMRMTGSWHVYRRGERWRRAPHHARLVLQTDDAVAVCFSAPVVELVSPGYREHHPALSRLGPDALAPELDLAGILERFRAQPDMPLGVALLEQNLMAGVGNVYKSEALFICGVNPFRTVRECEPQTLERLIKVASDLMRSNLGTQTRTTRRAPGKERYWVYGRSGLPCLRCRADIAMQRQGKMPRSTYFCPKCQA